MLEVLQRKAEAGARPPAASSAPAIRGLVAGWREGLAIVNLRGNAEHAAFRQAVASALGADLPVHPGTVSESSVVRVVWAGPDDWFIIGPRGHADALAARLREALAGLHHAVTDVSSGYTVLHLSGAPLLETRVNELAAFAFDLDGRVQELHVALAKQRMGGLAASVGIERCVSRPEFEAQRRHLQATAASRAADERACDERLPA